MSQAQIICRRGLLTRGEHLQPGECCTDFRPACRLLAARLVQLLEQFQRGLPAARQARVSAGNGEAQPRASRSKAA